MNTAAVTAAPRASATSADRHRPARGLRDAARQGAVLRVGGVLAGSLVLGGLTSWAQGFLPAQAAPFANSASGWAVLTVLLVVWSRTAGWRAAALGAGSFVLLVLGYTVASELRGLAYSPVLWGTVGLVTGPVIGLAASWLHGTGAAGRTRAAVGTAVVAGVGVGDGVSGLLRVADTTGLTYWVVVAAAGVALLVVMAARRLRERTAVLTAVLGTLAVPAAFVVGVPLVLGG